MSTKTILKVAFAFGVLAIVLIFLGVNFVPRIFASSSSKANLLAPAKQIRSDYIDERYPRSIAIAGKLPRADYVDESFPRAIVVAGIQARPDYIDERYPRAIVVAGKLPRPDYVDERYPRAIVIP